MPRPTRATPAELVTDWPRRASRDPAVETARQFALNLTYAMDGMSFRAAKAACGVDHTTISAIVNGLVWPDLNTIAKLEAGLGADLWPSGVAAQRAKGGKGKA